jgi:hypothetical protein
MISGQRAREGSRYGDGSVVWCRFNPEAVGRSRCGGVLSGFPVDAVIYFSFVGFQF